jgi:hypothetical protein
MRARVLREFEPFGRPILCRSLQGDLLEASAIAVELGL